MRDIGDWIFVITRRSYPFSIYSYLSIRKPGR